MKSSLYVLVVSLAIVSISCSKEDLHAKLPKGYLDSPKTGETITGTAPVVGWALSDEGGDTITAYVDGVYQDQAKTGVSRPDLVKLFPTNANAGTAGFNLPLDTTKIAPGPHELIVQARTLKGATRDLGDVMVNMVH